MGLLNKAMNCVDEALFHYFCPPLDVVSAKPLAQTSRFFREDQCSVPVSAFRTPVFEWNIGMVKHLIADKIFGKCFFPAVLSSYAAFVYVMIIKTSIREAVDSLLFAIVEAVEGVAVTVVGSIHRCEGESTSSFYEKKWKNGEL